MTRAPKDNGTQRRSRWPQFDVSLVVLLLVTVVLLLTFTFELWAPHGF